MSEHDPLCPWEFQHDCECGCPRTAFECKCDEYAAVRADEREKAAQRVELCVNKFKARDFNDAVDACAAAVRGES